jgi:polynucleotide 5'-hydroxyl-kinase GRC3/NOL9
LGHHFHRNLEALQKTELNTAPWTSTLSQIANNRDKTNEESLPCIVLSGKRSSGVATFLRCLVNRLLTQQNSSGLKQNSSVILVDLDHDRPELTPLGLVSAVHITEPLFGPSFTHCWKDSNLISMHASGIFGDRLPTKSILQIMRELLQISRQTALKSPAPIVVRLPEWIDEVEESQLSQLWNIIGSHQLISMGVSAERNLNPKSPDDRVTVHQIEAKAFPTKLGLADEVELKMHSYFHAQWQQDHFGGWYDDPLPMISQLSEKLLFGELKGEIKAIKLHEDQVALEDTVEATLGSICAMLVLPDEDSARECGTAATKPLSSILPRLALPTTEVHALTGLKCLGIAFVTEIQTDPPGVYLNTPVSARRLQQNRILLYVLPRRKQTGLVGNTGWIAKEIEAHG